MFRILRMYLGRSRPHILQYVETDTDRTPLDGGGRPYSDAAHVTKSIYHER